MTIKLKAPANTTSINIAQVEYLVGPDGAVDVSEAHVALAKEHGFTDYVPAAGGPLAERDLSDNMDEWDKNDLRAYLKGVGVAVAPAMGLDKLRELAKAKAAELAAKPADAPPTPAEALAALGAAPDGQEWVVGADGGPVLGADGKPSSKAKAA